MKVKSLKINMILNFIRTVLSMAFPMITFPYISRVLGVEQIGAYNFASSIISYYSLFAGLGILTYAIVEGTKIRDNRRQISEFASEMFSINFISTVVGTVILFLFVILNEKLKIYSILIAILSLNVWFNLLGIDWLYTIFEDYIYITVRAIIIQVLSIILLFVFVKSKQDLYSYAFITVVSSGLSNISNFLHSKKYCDIRLCIPYNWKKHLPPILILFATSIAISIYTNTDITMLGFFCSDYEVGVYSVSVKIYNIVKNVLLALNAVIQARSVIMISEEKKSERDSFFSKALNTLLCIIIPCMIGIIIMSEDIILFISGKDYINATVSLQVLAIALLFAVISTFYSSCILTPLGMENTVLKYTIIAAGINFICNIFLIPIIGHNAAALTTLIAEGLYCILEIIKANKLFKIEGMRHNIYAIIIGSLLIIIDVKLISLLQLGLIIRIALKVLSASIIYFVVQIIMKNGVIYTTYQNLFAKIRKVGKIAHRC